MADQALDLIRVALDRRAAGLPLTKEQRARCEREAFALERHLVAGTWGQTGGSENIAPPSAVAMGNWKLFVAMCRCAFRDGLGGSEAWSPTGWYFGKMIETGMVALRDARKARDADAVDVLERWLRAHWVGLALAAVRVTRMELHAYIGSSTPEVRNVGQMQGFTVPPVGSRAKHGVAKEDHHSVMLSHALNVPRSGREKVVLDNQGRQRQRQVQISDALRALLGVKRYTDSTEPEPWGLTRELRALLIDVADGYHDSAREAMPMMLGCQHGDTFEWRRTTDGVEKVMGGRPSANGPAVVVGQATEHGLCVVVQPETKTVGSNRGLEVERSGGSIRARCDTHPAWITVPEIGGDLVYRVLVDGPDPRRNVHFD